MNSESSELEVLPSIKKVEIRNFKSIKHIEIDFDLLPALKRDS